MLHFEGDKVFARQPAELWAQLSDARFLAECVPGIDEVKRLEPTTAVWTLRPGLAFVRGTLEVTLTVVEAVENSAVRLLIHSKGVGASSNVEVKMDVAPQDGATQIHWTADITHLGGLLKAVPQGLIKGAAQKILTDVWAQAEAKLNG
jgi:carbon monoxide dehydrogenase subunit G